MIPERFIRQTKSAKPEVMSQSRYRRFLEIDRRDNQPTLQATMRVHGQTVSDLKHQQYHGVTQGLSGKQLNQCATVFEMKRSTREVKVEIRPTANLTADIIKRPKRDGISGQTVGMMAAEAKLRRYERD